MNPFENDSKVTRTDMDDDMENVLNRMKDSVARSNQYSEANQVIGAETMTDLNEQREVLTNIQQNLHETDTTLGRAKKLTNRIKMRMFGNKILVYCILIMEIIILIGVVYWKFFT
ncbi:hypothetical protein SNEBB_002112 [Seison nebaliae]|nr:hypothetical protein SNEBB_002112 [Seison nebaliae]